VSQLPVVRVENSFVPRLLLSLALISGTAVASELEAFQFPTPIESPAAPPISLFRRPTTGKRVVRILSEAFSSGALVATTAIVLDATPSISPPIKELVTSLSVPLTISLDVGLVGWALGGKSNPWWSLLGALNGWAPVTLLNAQGGPRIAGMVLSVLLSTLAYEVSSTLREADVEREQELAYLSPPSSLLLPVASPEAHGAKFGWLRGAGAVGVATVLGGGTALALHTGIAAGVGCTTLCHFDPTSRSLPQVVPLIAIPIMLGLAPLLVHVWGQIFGGHGLYLFALMGAAIGTALALTLGGIDPALWNLWWAMGPLGAAIGWEVSSVVRENARLELSASGNGGAVIRW
jgi:hypothetical protein